MEVLRRAISQYQYLTHFMTGAACPAVSWGAFCRDPYILGDICGTHRGCCNQSVLHQYLHVIPQANCLLTADQQWALDWVGRVEHFEEDFQSLLAILNARGGGVPQLPAVEPQKMNANQSPCHPSTSRRRLAWEVINGTLNFCDKVGGRTGGRCAASVLHSDSLLDRHSCASGEVLPLTDTASLPARPFLFACADGLL